MQGLHLSFEHPFSPPEIHQTVLFLIIAVDLPAQAAIPGRRPLVGLQIQPRGLLAPGLDEFLIDQPVLDGDFCSGVPGNAPTGLPCLHQQIILPHAFQHMGAQQPCHAAADDQHPGAFVPLQRRKPGHFDLFFPNRCHGIPSLSLYCAPFFAKDCIFMGKGL